MEETMNNTITIGMSIKDSINARNSSVKLQSAPSNFKAKALAVSTDLDKETGKMRYVGYIVTEDGTVYGTVSATAIQTIRAIAEAVKAGDLELPIDLTIALKKSNQGREFICLSIA